jgi:hypothetical protein
MSGKIQTTPVATAIPFSNSANGFTATNVQTAIEEAKASSGGGSYDENKILSSATFEVLLNADGNVLRGS